MAAHSIPGAQHLPALAAMLEDHLGTPGADIHPAAHLEDDLHADELDLAAILVALECLYRIEISDAEGDACRTVADILALLDTKALPTPVQA